MAFFNTEKFAQDISTSWTATITLALAVFIGGAIMTYLGNAWTKPLLVGAGMALLVLLVSLVLKLLRAYKPEKKPTTPDNVESRMREWLDTFSFSVKRDPIPEAHFRYLVKTDGDLIIIIGRLRNELQSYLLLRVEIKPNEEERKVIAGLSKSEQSLAMARTKLELNRARIGYAGFTSLDDGFALTKRLPISEDLTEHDLMAAIGELEAAYYVAFLTAALFMEEKNAKTDALMSTGEIEVQMS